MTSYSRRQLPTLWKQAPNGQYAHVYEHVISRHIIDTLRKKGHLLVTDFDIWAHVYGTTIYIETRFQTNAARRAFRQALTSLRKITPAMIRHAATECSAEYSRPLTSIEVDTLTDALESIHAATWNPLRALNAEKASTSTSVNSNFNIEGLRFSRITPKSYHEIAIQYTVPGGLYDNSPALKALSALVIQALALNQNAMLTGRLSCYDTGDEWGRNTDDVGYRTYLRFHNRDRVSHDSAKQLVSANIEHLKSAPIAKHLVDMIQKNYADEASHYFSMQTLNDITGGVVVGFKGWQQCATIANTHAILASVEVSLITEP